MKKRGNLRSERRLYDYLKLLFLFAVVLGVIAVLGGYARSELVGNAVVLDGDSLRLDGEEVRLFGIDAPEFRQTCLGENSKSYDCGKRARQYLSGLLEGRIVVCSGFERDKYDRFLGTCREGDKDINEAMVLSGWAVSFGGYISAENDARRARRGIWQGDFQNPAAWREDERETHKRGFLSDIFGW